MDVDSIKVKLMDALMKSTEAHEAEAWANALRSFMVAVGIANNLKNLPNA